MSARPFALAAPAPRRARPHTIALLLLAAVVFGRVCGHEFVNLDDPQFIAANENFLPPTLPSLADHWTSPHRHLYAPVTMTAWWLIAKVALIGGDGEPYALNPWLFHAASLIVHVVNVLLVRRIVRAIVRDDLTAVLAAAVFAVHPLQVETVAWASELKDLLAACFSLTAIVAALRASEGDPQPASRSAAWWVAAFVAAVAAMLSKPSAAVLPLILAAILWLAGRSLRQWWIAMVVGLCLTIPVAYVARWAQPAVSVTPPPLSQRFVVAADALAFYVGKVLWPIPLGPDYGRTPAAVLASPARYWTWIVPVAVTAAALLSRRRGLIAAWSVFVLGVALNVGLLPFDFQAVSTVADHYAYLSLLGVAIAVAYAAANRRGVVVAGTVIVVILSAVSFVQAGRWRDSIVLWRHAIKVNPRSNLAYGNLGAALMDARDVPGARPPLRRAAELDPSDPFAHLNLARALLLTGDTEGATRSLLDMAAAYRRRRDFEPALTAKLLDNFANTVASRGDAASAARLREEAARLRG
jgi:hypothetical protein